MHVLVRSTFWETDFVKVMHYLWNLVNSLYLMSDAWQYDLDPDPRSRTQSSKVANMANFKVYLIRQFAYNQKTNASSKIISKFWPNQIFDIHPSLTSNDLQT